MNMVAYPGASAPTACRLRRRARGVRARRVGQRALGPSLQGTPPLTPLALRAQLAEGSFRDRKPPQTLEVVSAGCSPPLQRPVFPSSFSYSTCILYVSQLFPLTTKINRSPKTC